MRNEMKAWCEGARNLVSYDKGPGSDPIRVVTDLHYVGYEALHGL